VSDTVLSPTEVDPDMAVNIEHEDAAYDRLEGLALAADNLRAAANKM
jgi:sugar phosphate isomerase/epimerase